VSQSEAACQVAMRASRHADCVHLAHTESLSLASLAQVHELGRHFEPPIAKLVGLSSSLSFSSCLESTLFLSFSLSLWPVTARKGRHDIWRTDKAAH